MKVFLLIIVLTAATGVSAQTSNRQILSSMQKSLNSLCRGGSGDKQATWQACRTRTTVTTLLKTIDSPKSRANGNLAISVFNNLNSMCRGNSGDLPETQQACELRSQAESLLRNMGYTWRGGTWKKGR